MLHGYLVAYQRIPAFIVTLGRFLSISRLNVSILLRAKQLLYQDNWLQSIGTAYLPPIHGWILMCVGLIVSGYILLNQLIHLQHPRTYKTYLPIVVKMIATWGCLIAFVVVMNAYSGIPIQACILFGLAFIFHFTSNHTRFGRLCNMLLVVMRMQHIYRELTWRSIKITCFRHYGCINVNCGYSHDSPSR